jgi:uncharacterized protein YyaL (SSP411 family)
MHRVYSVYGNRIIAMACVAGLAIAAAVVLLGSSDSDAGRSQDGHGAADAAEPAVGGDADSEKPPRHRNRLAGEASPYLQLHAHNPVDWYPWGDDALALARSEDKPIFLSVGYSTCYWCHVMERKVFSDPDIAAYMNAHFVSIKVDREERPDLDEIYMKATHLMTGSGGWPNSVFLTPDGRPFYAGTYFPPEDAYGRPGFPRVLKALHEAWTNERQKVLGVAAETTQRIAALSDPSRGAGAAGSASTLDAAGTARRAVEQLAEGFDEEQGGFGVRMKFPRAPSLDLLLSRLEQGEASGSEAEPEVVSEVEVERMLVETLDAMAFGGIYDHLGDGFHRYSTEPTWSIPHFEKMLYDNAQLLSVYARAYALTKRPLYRRVVERTIAYLEREMSHPQGGFYSAQDAEVDEVEGASYVWRRSEIEGLLGRERAEAFFRVYELAPMPEDPEVGVLRVRRPVSALLEQAEAADAAALLARFDGDRAKLLAARSRRPQPLLDEKVLAGWNGLVVRGLVDAAAALDRPELIRRAERAARFVSEKLKQEDGTLRRSFIAGQAREAGVLEDYAFLADGLLGLHGATGDSQWLDSARGLADVLLARFEDEADGGFFMTPEGSDLLVRPKPFEDNAVPSGNGVALRVLRTLAARLEAKPEDARRYAKAADRLVASAGLLLERAPSVIPTTVAALGSASSASLASASVAAREPFRVPRSQDYVKARLVRSSADDPGRLAVQLAIDEGWHVNANPASLDFLIPTTVEGVDGLETLPIAYPKGQRFRPAFVSDAIEVYEGRVEIPVELAGDVPDSGEGRDDGLRLALRFQACDEERCLPPHRAVLSIGAPSGASP